MTVEMGEGGGQVTTVAFGHRWMGGVGLGREKGSVKG